MRKTRVSFWSLFQETSYQEKTQRCKPEPHKTGTQDMWVQCIMLCCSNEKCSERIGNAGPEKGGSRENVPGIFVWVLNGKNV